MLRFLVRLRYPAFFTGAAFTFAVYAQAPASTPIVLHAARLLEVDTGNILRPGEILVEGERIKAIGTSVDHPQSAKVIDLGDATLLPGLIDAHVHLFLHPGAEDLQTVEESVPWRTILAEQAAKADLMGGFTAERDMGTEGAGSADTAVRDAINQGLIPGPRLRISGNAIDILGGHEDANNFNPAQHVLSNADYANYRRTDCRRHARAAQGGLGLREDLRDRTGQDDRRRAAHAVPIHRSATRSGSGRGASSGHVCRRACHGRAGHALRCAGRRGFNRPRHAAERRNHAPDARKEHLCRAHLHHLRLLRAPPRLAGPGSSRVGDARLQDCRVQEADCGGRSRLRLAPTSVRSRTAHRRTN